MTTKHMVFAGLAIIAVIVIYKKMKKSDEPFAVSEGGMQTRPMAKA